MRQRVLDLLKTGDKLFTSRFPILNLWQTMAENFYPMRANFTRVRYISEEFASFLMTGRPAMAHRELANAFSSMLRPTGQQWFHIRTHDDKLNEDATTRAYLDDLSDRLRRILYDRKSQFVRATKEGDRDFAAFGNAVIEIRPRRDFSGLLFMCHHLRDVAWAQDAEKAINQVHVKYKPEARQLIELFPNTVSDQVKNLKNEDRFRPVECRRIVLPADEYDLPRQKTRGMPFVSIDVDPEHETILEEVPKRQFGFVIPRWETVSEHQYAYSPAGVLGLPDARMLQQMTLTFMEYGQKVVDPPALATGEVINGAINLFAGGMTYVDADYDERTGEALRYLNLPEAGLEWGDKWVERLHNVFGEIFYLSQIQFPQLTKDMTAFEANRLYEEFVRRSVPLFEPVTVEYNEAMLFESFNLAKSMGAFGPLPDELQGPNVRFDFDSPIKAAEERQKISSFQQALQLAAEAAQVDPHVPINLDAQKGFREAIVSIGDASEWLLDPEQVAHIIDENNKAAAFANAANQVAHGADTATRVAGAAESAGRAAQSLQGAM